MWYVVPHNPNTITHRVLLCCAVAVQLYDVESGDAKVTARRVVHVSDFHSGQVADFGMTKQIPAVSDSQSISQSPSASATEVAMMTTVVGTGSHSLA